MDNRGYCDRRISGKATHEDSVRTTLYTVHCVAIVIKDLIRFGSGH